QLLKLLMIVVTSMNQGGGTTTGGGTTGGGGTKTRAWETAPAFILPLTTLGRPRSSTVGAPVSTPRPMAGLPTWSASVCRPIAVPGAPTNGPPLYCNGPSNAARGV